ncbi:MAG: hypothetical protein M5U34_34160 [Chloroflexi bacterium]|nr:hypothetical protein [Chloroflexota bacterium]
MDYDDIPTLNEADLRRHDEGVAGVLHGEVVIERVALVYPYQQQHSTLSLDDGDSASDWQLLQPVWAFYGRSADGRDQFVIQVRAVRE